MRRSLFVGVTVLVGYHQAAGQCRVRTDSNEGKLLAFYTAPIVFSMATAPQEMRAGSIRIGGEGEYIPKPDRAIEQTGACFTQKSEHTSLSPVFGRPRVTIGGPFGFALEAAYLPPVTIARAKPNLFSFAVSHARHLAVGPALSGTTVMVRVHGTFGNVKGAITFHPDMFGGEIAAGFAPGAGRFSFYGGAGANRIDPHFQVGFTDANGSVDATEVQLEHPLTRASVFGGVTAVLRQILDVGLQVYSVPSDATLFRLNGGIRFR